MNSFSQVYDGLLWLSWITLPFSFRYIHLCSNLFSLYFFMVVAPFSKHTIALIFLNTTPCTLHFHNPHCTDIFRGLHPFHLSNYMVLFYNQCHLLLVHISISLHLSPISCCVPRSVSSLPLSVTIVFCLSPFN